MTDGRLRYARRQRITDFDMTREEMKIYIFENRYTKTMQEIADELGIGIGKVAYIDAEMRRGIIELKHHTRIRKRMKAE